jgi:protein-S-isoprenylcysteine O-methyltransferase Ste14
MKTKKHKGRPDLIGEHKVGDAGQAVFAILFLTVYITDSFILGFSTFLNEIVPDIIRAVAGILVLIPAGYFSMTGMKIVFDEVREKPEVIRKGVFSVVRHPVYFGEILLYLGLLFFSLSIASAVVWLFIIIFLYYISRYEEKILLDYFGDEYKTYLHEVPMWLPKISRIINRRIESKQKI